MKKNIMSLEEVDTMSRNIEMLESRLGHKVSSCYLKDDLSKDIMSLEEVDTMSRNIEMLESLRRCENNTFFTKYFGVIMFGIVALFAVIGYFI